MKKLEAIRKMKKTAGSFSEIITNTSASEEEKEMLIGVAHELCGIIYRMCREIK